MIDREKLAQNLKAARDGKKQKEIAEQAKIAPQTLSAYETAKRLPTLEDLVSLANVLDCSVDELLGRDITVACSRKELTMGDLMRLIDSLYWRDSIRFDEVKYSTFDYTIDIPAIGFTNNDLAAFIDAYQKMRELKENKILDNELFNQWLEGQIAKKDSVVLYPLESIFVSDFEELDGDLPF